MKRIIFNLAIAGLMLNACNSGKPDIALSQTEVDLGHVANGEVRTFEVVVENLGNEDLLIEGVTTSCGCTTAEVQPVTIPPGGDGVLIVSYDSGAHGPEFNGSVTRQVFIASNDPDEAEFELRFTAEVTAPGP